MRIRWVGDRRRIGRARPGDGRLYFGRARLRRRDATGLVGSGRTMPARARRGPRRRQPRVGPEPPVGSQGPAERRPDLRLSPPLHGPDGRERTEPEPAGPPERTRCRRHHPRPAFGLTRPDRRDLLLSGRPRPPRHHLFRLCRPPDASASGTTKPAARGSTTGTLWPTVPGTRRSTTISPNACKRCCGEPGPWGAARRGSHRGIADGHRLPPHRQLLRRARRRSSSIRRPRAHPAWERLRTYTTPQPVCAPGWCRPTGRAARWCACTGRPCLPVRGGARPGCAAPSPWLVRRRTG